MRVSHVITRLIVGGAQENTIATVLGLRKIPGVDVELISGPTTGPEGSLESHVTDAGAELRIIPDLIRPVRPASDIRALRALTAHFRQTRPDIVHTHSGKAGILGRIAARRAKTPLIIHGIHGPSFGPFQGGIANLIFRNAERYAGTRTDHFVVVAQAMADQYMAAGIGTPDKYSIIYSGFPLERYLASENSLSLRARLGIEPDDVVVGKIGRLFELKGHDDLFAVAPDLVARCPKLKFLLVGDGPWRNRFEALTSEKGLAKHVVFTGLVPPREIPALVGIMDMLVHLSLREGLPRALPQALAAAKPVVAYNCDGAGEVCLDGQTGFLLAPRDLEGLKDRISALYSDPALRQRLGATGQALVRERFSVEKMVKETHDLYVRLRGAR